MAEKIPAASDQPVFIAKSKAIVLAKGFDRPTVAIIPDTNDWNDFGRAYFAKLYIVEGATELFQAHLRIMFEGHNRSETALKEYLSEFGEIFPIEQLTTPYVSLLPDEDLYGSLIKCLGFDNGITALRSLHDAVVLRFENDNQPLVEMTFGIEFSIGVLRHGVAYTALRRGSRHFTREPVPSVNDSAQNFSLITKLKNATNEIEVNFDFEKKPVFRDRIAILVGQNGTGKTQLLKSIVDGLVSKNDDEIEGFPRFTHPVNIHRTLVFSSVATDPFPRRIGAWEGIDYDYLPLNSAKDDNSETLLEALVALRFENGTLGFEDGKEIARLDILLDVLKDLGLKRLCLPLRKRQDDDDLPNIVEIGGNSYLPIRRRLGEQNTLNAYQQIDWAGAPTVLDDAYMPRELSSGELAMLRFTAQSIAAIETGSLLLLDEPETHLHPKFISDLMEVLYSLLQATNSIAIIATHSAYIVREVSRDNVKVLSVEDGILSFDTPRMQTFGASIDTISQFAFGDTNEQHHFQQVLINWAQSVEPEIGLEGIIKDFGEHLNSESLSFIARFLAQKKQDG
jgi:ABC-type transporter Mla maintaining outer membrane lipid asymmetry ATPase subunit MlaF